MTDAEPINMAPFFAAHERAARRTFVASLAVSLAASIGSVVYGTQAGSLGVELWMPMVLIPLALMVFRAAITRWERARPVLPDGRLPMNPDDARSARHVANAGAVFVAGVSLAAIFIQGSLALWHFGALASQGQPGELLVRAGLVGLGVLMVYFGNAWPRMPTPRGPGQRPAAHKTFNRLYGWIVVSAGTIFVLAAVLLPPLLTAAAVGAASLGLMLGVTVITARFYRAMKSPSA